MGIAGTKWKRNDAGEVILDKTVCLLMTKPL